MSMLMDDEIKRWTARRKSALVLEIIQGKTTVAEASRAHDLPPSEIEKWLEDGKRGMENALRANPQDLREQYEKQLKDLQVCRKPTARRCWRFAHEKKWAWIATLAWASSRVRPRVR